MKKTQSVISVYKKWSKPIKGQKCRIFATDTFFLVERQPQCNNLTFSYQQDNKKKK